MPEYSTIKDCFLAAVKEEPYAGAGSSSVYSLDVYPGLDGYLLKINRLYKEHFEDILDQIVELTPVHFSYKGTGQAPSVEVGQPLLSAEGIQIISKIPGKSLHALFVEAYQNERADKSDVEAGLEATRNVLKILDSIPTTSFVKMMEVTNDLTLRGLMTDPHWGNFIVDNGDIRMIDVFYPSDDTGWGIADRNNLENFIDALTLQGRYAESQKMLAYCANEIRSLDKKLREAAKIANFPENSEQAEIRIEMLGIRAAELEPIETLGKIPLSASPETLIGMLKTIEQTSPIFKVTREGATLQDMGVTVQEQASPPAAEHSIRQQLHDFGLRVAHGTTHTLEDLIHKFRRQAEKKQKGDSGQPDRPIQ